MVVFYDYTDRPCGWVISSIIIQNQVGGKMKMREKASMFVLVIMALFVAFSATAMALPTVEYIKINGDEFESGDRLVVERGEKLDIKVKLQGTDNETDLEVRVDILGYEYNDWKRISDSTHVLDIKSTETVYKTLSVNVPENSEKDDYDLRVRVGGRTGASSESLFRLSVQAARHALDIKDIVFSPEGEVVAGRALLATLRIKNVGEKDEESVKVTVSIPELGISASDYIDEIEEEESVTSEELYLRIPKCVEAGIYKVRAKVEFDEGYEAAEKETTVRVLEGDNCEVISDKDEPAKTVITVGSTVQDVAVGEGGVVYPITVSNSGSVAKTYRISVDGTEGWSTVKVTPSSTVVLSPGETKSVYVYVSANEDAPAGERMFSVAVMSGLTVLKEIPLKANVVTAEKEESSLGWDKVKKALEVGLIVLVVLLVILGLIIGFNKLKGRDDEEDDSQTYY
jgi:uncharacterized membrane protein